ncbi:DRMBL-domain-containing protein [Hypoxylon rubiginosum]|uniref:DRMBL-domain-containing protein n=1 Tax=Hypoxylon rubiginosum TaxID=110542 RepID=A0ACB9ZAD3_9PEZI|nr:DRMBL-domain-containing protein [Hypoxylon rubiginosum]
MAPSKTAKPITPRRQSKLNFGSAAGGKNANAKTSVGKKPANGNILNFFQKIEVEEQLFCADLTNTSTSASASVSASATAAAATTIPAPTCSVNPEPAKNEDDLFGDEYIAEESRSPKRRKLSHDGIQSSPLLLKSKDQDKPEQSNSTVPERTLAKRPRKKGKIPFLNDSDSEDDDIQNSSPVGNGVIGAPQAKNNTEKSETAFVPDLPVDESCLEIPHAPPLQQGDSVYEDFKDLEDIEGLFDGVDEFDDGEEYRERRYMEEQARLEAEDAGNYTSDGLANESHDVEGIVECCPLCNASLAGIGADQATVHVNACLDSNPIPLSKPENPPPPETVDAPEVSKRFAKAAVPRPGQSNPISLGSTANQPTSAFSKLMSGHAEDAAWASAAASEHSSRGKPAYQRTCPFYKIMPGFSICVDAFRYGAVKGCNAYFLSHFHSDHYIGLTANWSHGPIYCSKVTGSLVKNQLRTAAKWVKEIEFEETVEIPGTEGVTVTMLPANHCPGSSLFLFEKTIGKGPRKQRILHCGDFRACPAQVAHSLLKPETVDAVSGKVKQQRIDVCYLDTTYLNPRYSFPPQDDVIMACAEFCKSISGDAGSAEEFLSAARQEKGTMSQFFQKEDNPSTATKAEGGSKKKAKNRLLVICGTYSIGKERICKAIAQALGTKIFASASKIKICSQLGDPELAALMTSDPLEAQVHMQMLMEIRAETLQDYLDGYKPHFSRVVGFRPSGWNYRSSPTGGNAAKGVAANTSPGTVQTTSLLHGPAWRTRFSSRDLTAQRGSTREAMCFGVPYSEHSSFRELALFLMALRIEKVVPTVNVGSEPGRRRMKGWIDRWLAERRKGGIVRVLAGDEEEEMKKNRKEDAAVLWEGKDGKGGGVWW